MRIDLLLEPVVAELGEVGLLGGRFRPALLPQGVFRQGHDDGERQGIIQQDGHRRIAPLPAAGLQQQERQARDEDHHEGDQQPFQRRSHLLRGHRMTLREAPGNRQDAPSDDHGADEGRKRINHERRSEDTAEQARRSTSQQHADDIDRHHGHRHEHPAHAAVQAEDDDQHHGQQREHHLVLQAAQAAEQRDGRVQQREAEDDPEILLKLHANQS